MLYRFTQNLGSDDARFCNDTFKADLNWKECVIGAIVDLPQNAADHLLGKYKGLLEPTEKVRGVAKTSEITAPAK